MKTIVAEVGTIFLAAVIILMILGTSTSSFFTGVNAKTKQKNSKSGSTSSTSSTSTASDKTSSHTVKNGKTKRTKMPNTNTGGKGGTGGGTGGTGGGTGGTGGGTGGTGGGTGGTGGGTGGTGGGTGGTGGPPVIIQQPPRHVPPIIKIPPTQTCIPPMKLVNGKCVIIHIGPTIRCPPGTHLVGNHCVPNTHCQPGFHLEGFRCVPNGPLTCRHDCPCPQGTHREGTICVKINQVIRIIHKDVTNKHVTIERIINNVPVQQTVTNIPLKEFIDNLGSTNVILPTVNFVDANGILHIVGTVTNNGNSDVKIVNILATLEGNNKNILQIAHGLPVVNKLKANESTTFEIQVLQTLFKVSDIKKVTFHVDAQ